MTTTGPRRDRRTRLSTFSSLAVRDFRYLWLGSLLMSSGNQMQVVAQGFLVYEITGSAKLLGIVSAGSGLSMFGLALLGGVIADRIERKLLIQLAQAGSGAIALLIALSIVTESISWVYVLIAAIAQGALWSFWGPANHALIPQLVGVERVGNAIALNASSISIMVLLGPAVGGVLYASTGPEGAYFAVTASRFVALLLTSRVRRPPREERPAVVSMMAEMTSGLKYVRTRPLVLLLLAMGLSIVVLVQPFGYLLPTFVGDVYNRASGSYGLLLSIGGLGSLVGTLIIASMGKWRRGLVLIAGSFVTGVSIILIAALPYYGAALAIMMFFGLGESARRALTQALILEQVDNQFRGRVMSLYMMESGLMVLGVVPAGFAIDRFGSQPVFAVMGAILLTVAVVVLATQKRLRDLQ